MGCWRKQCGDIKLHWVEPWSKWERPNWGAKAHFSVERCLCCLKSSLYDYWTMLLIIEHLYQITYWKEGILVPMGGDQELHQNSSQRGKHVDPTCRVFTETLARFHASVALMFSSRRGIIFFGRCGYKGLPWYLVWKSHNVHLLYQYRERFSNMAHP